MSEADAEELVIIKTLVDAICREATALTVEQALDLVNEIERTDSFMSIFDPTAYLKVRDTIPGHAAAARAFLDFRAALEKLK